jgi:dipeptidyl aminopeptidase/acylaminoacyl peptidase
MPRRIMILSPTLAGGGQKGPIEMKDFYALVENVAKDFPVDLNHVYLAGASSGSLLARWIVFERPAFWKGVILVASPPWGEAVQRSRDAVLPPLLFVHGEQDNLLPAEKIKADVAELKALGREAELILDPEAGHTHKPEWNKSIFDWIKSHE